MIECSDEKYAKNELGGICLKRRLVVLACLIALMGCLTLTASAQSTASKIEIFSTVNSDGDCLVNMSVTLHLEGKIENLQFPLPAGATGVTLNKASCRTEKTKDAVLVDLSRLTDGVTGDFTMQFDYVLKETVAVAEDLPEIKETNPDGETLGKGRKPLQLTLPLLGEFAFPVEKVNFVITLPGPVTNPPRFTSIYRQYGVESILPAMVDGSMISGGTTAQLNDHESVTMTLVVPDAMFPSVNIYERTGNPEIVPMSIFAGLALLYWLIFLRCAPLIRYRNVNPPDGITAGELGCRLTLAGGDLTMMVLSWAQLGYILINMDRSGRIILHKRMDMGNERSLFEIRIFKSLFGTKNAVDATGFNYAKLVRKVARMVPGEKTMCKTESGSMKVFRALCCMVQVFCGICVAMNMTAILALQILLSVVLGVFGAVSAWHIQNIAYRTHLRGKNRVFVGLGLMVVWILLGLLCGQVWIPLVSVLGQFLFSYFAAYGGRRSDLNRHDVGQILGLRHYMKRISREEMVLILKNEPEYFFDLAPYALAMGILRPFARNFGPKKKWELCPYLIVRHKGRLTAAEWASILRNCADRMDARAQRMELERWMPIKFR